MNEIRKETVCGVVVTFNRKELLKDCLQALTKQTRPLDAILIVDNASTDNTPQALLEIGYIQQLPPEKISKPYESEFLSRINNVENENIKIIYIRMNENTGGAGGFHQGVKRGYELGYDWLWLMDDDGLPRSDALEKLLSKKDKANFLNPIVLNKDNFSSLSFGLFDRVSFKTIKTYSEALNCATEGLIFDTANPFNGTFISKELVQEIGYPKKEMFIWGDEVEYQLRALKSGLGVATVVEAIHFHPEGRVETVEILDGRYKLNYQKSRLKNYCDMRNRAYIQWRYGKKTQLIKYFLAYSYYFLTKMMVREWYDYMKASFHGIFSVWGNEKRFL
ncbi:glycosyltransferase family 2 protein [Galenea microaerophila]